MNNIDKAFFERVDKQIALSNSQVSKEAKREDVQRSNMYATARFNAWTVACNWDSAEAMEKGKHHTVEYFTNLYKQLLEENLNDYIQNFDKYMNYKK